MSPAAAQVTRRQALGFRVGRHHLAERLDSKGAQTAPVVGLQDTPPATAALALAARADVAPEALEELVLVPSIRGTPMAVAERDLAVFTAGLEPPDEEAARAVVAGAWKFLDGVTAMDALDRVSEAVHDSLRDGPLPRDDFHQALRERRGWWHDSHDSVVPFTQAAAVHVAHQRVHSAVVQGHPARVVEAQPRDCSPTSAPMAIRGVPGWR